MNYAQRKAFRRTKAWQALRAKCRLHTSKDFITKQPLERDWNLHHLDLDISRYDQIDDMNKFIPLNSKTHELIHELYKLYRKDKSVICRIIYILAKMEEYTNGSRTQ